MFIDMLIMFLKRFLFIIIILTPNALWCQTKFKPYVQITEKEIIDFLISSSDTIPLNHRSIIFALSIDATIVQPKDNSFVRIVLEDTEGHNHLVAESDHFRNDTSIVNLMGYCEETALLNGIIPVRLKCYLSNATLRLTGIHMSSDTPKHGIDSSVELKKIRTEQVRDIVSRINESNYRHKKLWEAGVTTIALMNLDEKVKILGVGLDTNTDNIEYYSGGIFEFGNPTYSRNMQIVSPYINTFDWSNRHGKYWLTPIRWQKETPYCTAFAVSAGVETMRNLYYNNPIMDHLSVQELACCAKYNPNPEENGQLTINVDSALLYTQNFGIMPDSVYPFDENALQICLSGEKQPDEKIGISGYISREQNYYYSLSDTILKRDLINEGPHIYWIHSWNSLNHAMLLVGYGQIQEGMELDIFDHYVPFEKYTVLPRDPRIGKTYWKFKNSWGLSSDNGSINGTYDGFMYMIINDQSIISKGYSIITPITSELLSDSDIICEDNDGDGLFNWGIGPIKPNHCPMWAQPESDGNDSDWTKGHMNKYGFCEELPNTQPIYQYISNDSILQDAISWTKHLGLLRGSTVTFKARQTFEGGKKLLLDNGATLVLDGTIIEGECLQAYSGSKIILNNGAKILKPFTVPLGVKFVINKGTIE